MVKIDKIDRREITGLKAHFRCWMKKEMRDYIDRIAKERDFYEEQYKELYHKLESRIEECEKGMNSEITINGIKYKKV